MNIIDFLRANYYYWNNRFVKIVPINFAYAFMKVWIVIMILIVFCVAYPFPNHEYYKCGISGIVEKIEREPKNWNIKIDSNWYFVRYKGINHIMVDRRIVKKPNSWLLTIYDSTGIIKYQDSIQRGTFKLIEKRNH